VRQVVHDGNVFCPRIQRRTHIQSRSSLVGTEGRFNLDVVLLGLLHHSFVSIQTRHIDHLDNREQKLIARANTGRMFANSYSAWGTGIRST
jgi:hypothetical protein